MNDVQFFETHKKRQARIRDPEFREFVHEFLELGPHKPDREKVLVWKVPTDNSMAGGGLLRIPMLQFADENVEDTDEILLPIIDELMRAAALEYGIKQKGH